MGGLLKESWIRLAKITHPYHHQQTYVLTRPQTRINKMKIPMQ